MAIANDNPFLLLIWLSVEAYLKRTGPLGPASFLRCSRYNTKLQRSPYSGIVQAHARTLLREKNKSRQDLSAP